ncbi:alpha/beta hydrolase [Sphaerisporangium siamense]|uniref:Pimeloyl-ACP methyl ester carboxylesterase n=1 Tax=Sphaerisporangium siamense TaxID=795645 RepID=A0A7W7D7T9_9ACTN|nr:alpha/beta fold hydrolase [Sphaerisporangium siamense]MBB4701867.1 pimeloyl-ACP methyl ester carboxylesterase [Sphaerisporangium siamense]GII84225.1 alpha/beta hydrolase [Sphaerisporangium siamense]
MSLQYCDLTGGARLPYVEFGAPGGAPLLVLRGLGDALTTMENPGTAAGARALYGPLAHRRVVVTSWRTPAAPGHRLDDLVGDAATLITTLGLGPAAIWGNSMGGMVALLLAERHPDLVDSIVCECTPSHAADPLLRYVTRWDAMAARRRWPELQRDTLRNIFTGRMPWAFRKLVWFPRSIPIPDDEGRWQVLSAALREYDIRDRAAGVRCPVLVIGGRRDRMTPPDQLADLADRLPDARLVLVDRCGHGASLERPEEFHREAGRFLAEARRSTGH